MTENEIKRINDFVGLNTIQENKRMIKRASI